MRSTNWTGILGGMIAAGTITLVPLVVGPAAGQVRDDGTRTNQSSGREGGIPRKALGQEREREREEGLEEGTPDVQAQPGLREAMPRFRAPPADWKLGVWAYNTENGVIITRVAPDSAAAREGLEQGDRIVGVGGYQVGYVGDLLYPLGFELRRQADSRGQVLLLVQNVRDRELLNLTVQLDRPGRVRPQPLERP